MKLVIQRVSEAKVEIDGRISGAIGPGLMVLLAIHKNDEEEQLKWLANKLVKLRIFHDDEGKMNRSVADTGGGILVISQFTLYGDARKGTRPGFTESAPPEKAEALYDAFVAYVKTIFSGSVQTGEFAAMMDVSLINSGPVTIILEKENEI
ncbi:MAG: D-tyrosyl-tRNA(Tyr) deacylase [Balneolales bacterium]|nr:D-tyrosyl-tRNA(Tyr) deacylase [Balneolales bacterium]